MGKFRVKIEKTAEIDLRKQFKSGNKLAIKKIELILLELAENPFEGTGKPEQLKHDLIGFWSRRINQKDRLIYRVDELVVTVFVISAMGHYSDH